MTERYNKTAENRHNVSVFQPTRLLFIGMSVFCLALILRNSELAVRYMTYGLRLCVVSVIPALFPFMVLSELIVSTGAVQLIGRFLSRPFHLLFGVSGDSAGALLLGWLCGFPVGIRAAVALYRRGSIDKAELSRLLTFSNMPSSAFLVSTVGISLFGDRSFGVSLYIITLISSLLIGIFGNLLEKKKKSQPKSSPRLASEKKTLASANAPLDAAAFTDAIASSAIAMLQICAFVVFFSVLSGTLSYLFDALSLPTELICLLFGTLEMTGGTAKAAELAPPLSKILCAFFVGWSGISVHCQLMSLCSSVKVSLRPYLLAKLAHGLLNVFLLLLLRLLF